MKNIILLLLPLIILSCGTDQGEGKTYHYTVKNESGKSISIKAFKTSYPSVNDPRTTLLDIGEELSKTYKTPPPPPVEIYSFESFFEGDSIVVTYANEKYQTFISNGCNGGETNPLNRCIYGSKVELFTFTEEDYENAEDCDVNCD